MSYLCANRVLFFEIEIVSCNILECLRSFPREVFRHEVLYFVSSPPLNYYFLNYVTVFPQVNLISNSI